MTQSTIFYVISPVFISQDKVTTLYENNTNRLFNSLLTT